MDSYLRTAFSRQFGITTKGEVIRCVTCGYNLPVSLEKHHPEDGNPETFYLCRNCHHIVTYWIYWKDSFLDYYLALGESMQEFIRNMLLIYKAKTDQMVALGKLSKPSAGLSLMFVVSAEELSLELKNRVARFGIISLLENNLSSETGMRFREIVSAMEDKGFTINQTDHAIRQLHERGTLLKPRYGYWALKEPA